MNSALGDWLKDLGLGQYAEAFAENGVDFDLLPELTNDDLKDLGLSSPGRPQAVAQGDR